MKNNKILILGAGLAGLATAYFLKKRDLKSCIFEKENAAGGLCRSQKKDGFTFDSSGHLLHFRERRTLSLVKGLLGNNLVKHKRDAQVYTFDRLIPYPFQANLHFLPKKIAQECLSGFIEAQNNGKDFLNEKNFLKWLNERFGRGIAKYFMIPYNEKFWLNPLNRLTNDWTERFIVTPSIKDIIQAYYGKAKQDLGYSAHFWYPVRGGIGELARALSAKIKSIHLNYEAQEIDIKKKLIRFRNGRKEKFDVLISTIPLPELGRMVKGGSNNPLSYFKKLRWLSIYNVNLGIEGEIQPAKHWIYFPQNNICFFKVGFFHNFSSHLAPKGKSSLYADISYSQRRPIVKSNIVPRIIEALRKTGIVPRNNKICVQDINDIKYGYPIYDINYKQAKGKIMQYLNRNNIFSIGRYGNWRYLSMEDVILEGEHIAHLL